MHKDVFREKSLERIESPDQLNEYIMVANPRVWIILATVVVLLIGFLVWGTFGDLSIYKTSLVKANEGEIPGLKSEVLLLVPEANDNSVNLGQYVEIDGEYYQISEEADEGVRYYLSASGRDGQDSLGAHYLGYDLVEGESLWLVPYGLDCEKSVIPSDVCYVLSRVEIATRSPLSFLFD